MKKTILFAVLLTSVSCLVISEPPCSRGEKWFKSKDGVVDCLACDGGTYMPENEHVYQQCLNCTQIKNPDVEILVIPCNRFHDAVILCKNGHYRYTAHAFDQQDRCEQCSQCQFPEYERGCQGYSDTVCCDPAEETGTTGAKEVVCKGESVVCGPGQFLRISTDECSPCSAETFMSDHNHVNKQCLQCEQLSENTVTHAIIIRPCSRTAPTLFGCEDGYFRDPTQESSQKEVPCSPCRSCNKSLVDCGMFHDAICVDQDPMTYVAPSNLTQPIETSEANMIIHFIASLNGSGDSCIHRCAEDELLTSQGSSDQSVATIRNCLINCLSVADNIDTVSTWLRAVLGIVLSVLYIVFFLLKQNYLVVCSDQSKYCGFTWFTYALCALNALDVMLFIIMALLESRIIKDQGQGSTKAMTVICYGILIVSLTCVMMFVRNEALNKVEEKGGGDNSAETEICLPPVDKKLEKALTELQAENST